VLDANRLHDREAVELWHLNVEEDEIRHPFLDGGHGIATVPGFADDVDIRIRREQCAKSLARHSLVVDNEGPHGHGAMVVAGAPIIKAFVTG
jgi:hypothetical protein